MRKIWKLALGLLLVVTYVTAEGGVTTRVSVSSSGVGGNHWSWNPSISGDGRRVAFESGASNLVEGDTNDLWDVFAHDSLSGLTRRVSVSTGGAQADGTSGQAAISADGRYVAFVSDATNLVPAHEYGWDDVFLHDLQTGETTIAALAHDGTQGTFESSNPSISADGRFLVFDSWASNFVPNDDNGLGDVFRRDLQTGQIDLVSCAHNGAQGNNPSQKGRVSADGSCVAFVSSAKNLVPGDTNEKDDVFVRDFATGQISLVSVSGAGAQGNGDSGNPSMSGDGRFVAFSSWADNLVTGDTNEYIDVFVHDRQTGITVRVSVSSNGTQGDRWSGYEGVSISGNGRYVTFDSNSTTFALNDSPAIRDVYMHDLQTGQTTKVSLASDGSQADAHSFTSSVNEVGLCVAFMSWAGNLVPGYVGVWEDCYVRDTRTLSGTKALPSGVSAVLSAQTVTASFPGFFYVEDADRSCGVKVAWSGAVTVRDRHRVEGILATGTDGERYVTASTVRRVDTMPLPPLGMQNVALGGSDKDYDFVTGGGQEGIAGARGMNNIGLLIRTWGVVTHSEAGFFYLDDGSALEDGSGHTGVKVLGSVPDPGPVGKFVQVNGISSCFKSGDDLHRLIRATDVTVIP